MPKFSTHFPFIKSSRPGTPVPTQASTPEPDNPAAGNTTLGGAAMRAVAAPQASTLPAVNVAPPTSADPQANVAAPGNVAESQDVPRLIATDDPPKSWLRKLRTPGAMRARTPEHGDPAAGNVTAGNIVTQATIVPQVSTSLPVNVTPSVGTEPQANTLAPISVPQLTEDSHVNVTDLTREAVREGSARDVRPVTTARAEPTPEINVEVMETRKEDQKQVDTAPTSAEAPVLGDMSRKDVRKTKITRTTGWMLLKGSFKAVNDLSDAFPPLKAAVTAILVVMDYVDMVQGNEDKLKNLAIEVNELVRMFTGYSFEDIPQPLYAQLDTIIKKLAMIRAAVEQKMQSGVIKRTIAAFKDMEDIVDMCEEVSKLLHRLSFQSSVKAYVNTEYLRREDQLKNLGHIHSASINAIREDGCLAGTQIKILEDLEEWCHNFDAPPVYWLVGPAGAGKSTIARTFSRSLQDQLLLGGSFFCHRPTAERADAKHIIPTLAWGLARRDPGYCHALMGVTDIASVAKSIVKLQIDELLKEQCKFLTNKHLIFVVDALDECHDQDIVRDLLQQLSRTALGMGIKFFITSRPDPHIQKELNYKWQSSMHQTFRLQDVEKDIVTQDIFSYIHHALRNVQMYNHDIPPEWPSQSDVNILTQRAEGLFVFAATALRFIGRNDPRSRLEMLIKSPGKAGKAFISGLDDMYTFILTKAMDPKVFIEDEILLTRNVLEMLIAARAPLTIPMIAKFLGKDTSKIWSSLNHLHAVVQVPDSGHDDDLVTTYHASFPDFLVRLKVDTHWNNGPTSNVLQELFQNHYLPIGLSSGHHLLAIGCTTIMKAELKFNIVQCPSSFLRNSEQQLQQIEKALLYACLNWPYHIIQAANSGVFLDFCNQKYQVSIWDVNESLRFQSKYVRVSLNHVR
ncbi:hypothetical protein EYR40_010211 [Pleurotus pulmonarius]|nr:hypothetical protein EYR40_010211 [Pleurotus pulmonarius]